MKHPLRILAFLVFTAISHGGDFLMGDYGTFVFTGDGYSVRIELVEGDNNGLAPKIIFQESGKLASTGIGKGSHIPIVAEQWAAEFQPPHELWIYDGKKNLQLYERTINPNGFKSSSSAVVPELFFCAPEKLKKLMSENIAETETKLNKQMQATGVPLVPDP